MSNFILMWFFNGNLFTEHYDKEECVFKRYYNLCNKFGGSLDFEIGLYKIIQ